MYVLIICALVGIATATGFYAERKSNYAPNKVLGSIMGGLIGFLIGFLVVLIIRAAILVTGAILS